jgi:hypothetical protein
MSSANSVPKFQSQFEEIARLEEALRLGRLEPMQAAEALRRICEIMNWQLDGRIPAQGHEMRRA